MYKRFNDTTLILDNLCKLWSNKFGHSVKTEFIKKALCTNELTNIAKYISFQFRLIHNIVFLNDRLYHFGKVHAQTCSLCGVKKETRKHYFYECQETLSIWQAVVHYIKSIVPCEPNITYENIVANSIVNEKNHFANLMCLLVK